MSARQIIYAGAVPLDTDLLNTQRFIQATLGSFIQGFLGSNTLVDGFTCIPNSPANLTVQVTPGSIYQLAPVDPTAFGSLAADNSDEVMKIGTGPVPIPSNGVVATQTFSCPAPGTTGFSINYLIEVAFQEIDINPLVLSYFNSANPQVPLSGPPQNPGLAQNTQRVCQAVFALKAGTAAATGTQTTPTVDAGNAGVFVVTVANGQSTITAANISTYPSAPFIAFKPPALAQFLGGPGALAGAKLFPLIPNLTDATTRAANTANLQAAIDYAYNNGLQVIRISAGNFFFNPPIYLDAPGNLRAAGQIAFTTNPVAGTAIVIFGTTVTFVNSGATGNQVNIGASLANTLSNLLTFLQGSADINISKFTYGVAGNNLNVTAVSGTPTVLGTTVSGATVTAGASVPTIFSFSLQLQGAGGLSNHNGQGTRLNFLDNSQVALISGPGQGMGVSRLSIIGPAGATSLAALPVSGAGIGFGGHSRCLFEGVGVENFRRAYYCGFNGYNILGDSNTLFKCTAFGNFIGYHVGLNQNYIHSLINCDFGGNATHILSDVAKAVNVYGGNYSSTSFPSNAFAISSVSSLSYFLDSSQVGFGTDNATFTCTISSPDQPLKDGAYDAFVINTVAFGAIPLLLTNFNSSTNVATFKFYQGWLLGSGMQTGLLNGGALETTFNTALGAATTLYACETCTPFKGFCFNVDGVHIENPGVYTCFFNQFSGFGGDFASKFNRITFNHTLSQNPYHGSSPNLEAIFQCQQAFSFVQMLGQNAGTVEFSNIVNVNGGNNDRVNFDVEQSSVPLYRRVIVKNCDIRPNLRSATSATLQSGIISTGSGFGEWDATPFIAGSDTTLQYTQPTSFGAVPFYGYFPAPWATPSIDQNTLATVQGTLPALGSYPALMGRTPYRVYYPSASSVTAGVNAARWVESNHTYWSYGQNLTMNWSYVAGTNVVAISDFRFVFAGLRILMNNGSGNESYVVTGVFPSLGFMTVVRWRPGTGVADLAGTAGTTYTGTVIGQEPFSFSYSGFLPATSSPVNSTAGATTANAGDMTGAQIVNLKLTAVGANAYTTRTAAQIISDIPGAYAGMTWEVRVENTNAGTTTITAPGGGGITLVNTMTVAQNNTRILTATITSITSPAVTFESRGVLTGV